MHFKYDYDLPFHRISFCISLNSTSKFLTDVLNTGSSFISKNVLLCRYLSALHKTHVEVRSNHVWHEEGPFKVIHFIISVISD